MNLFEPKYKKFTLTSISCLLTVVLSGCAAQKGIKHEKSALTGLDSKSQSANSNALVTEQEGELLANQPKRIAPLKSVNTISPQEQLKQQQYRFDRSAPVKIAVENMPLRDFVHYIFGDLLGVNYVVDEGAVDNTQNVSLKVEDPIPANNLFELVADVLKAKQVNIQLKQNVFYVFKGDNNQRQKDILLGLGSSVVDVPVGSEEVLQLVPLKYTSYGRIQRVMYNLVNAEVYAEADYAGVTIKGKRSQVIRALNLIQLLDQPSAKSQFIGLYPLVFLNPKDFETHVMQLLTQDGFDVQYGVTFTPIEHLNSVIVHASNQQILNRVEMWKSQLDKASETADKQYFIFYPKRANASALGESLNNILALQRGGSTGGTARTAMGNTGNNANNRNTGNRAAGNRGGTQLEGIAVDEQRNALVFYMQPKEYQALYPMLKQLDVLPKQVVIEATLLEVTLTDKLNYGVEWFIKNSTDSFGTKGGIGEVAGGLTYTLTKPSLDVLVNALASENQVNIVSNPKLMVTNGETATLSVGTDIPTISSTVENATEGNGQVLQSIQYRNTGMTLTVTPKANAQNFVELDISQVLSEAGENELSGIDSPIVLNREIQTKVLVSEGETLVLAGLISENRSGTDTKVPLLGDIPILGEAFKNTSKSTVKTELLLLITPIVVSNSENFRQIRRAISSKFEQIDLEEDF